MVAIWKRHLEENGGSPSRLPPILPLVFYHGARGWTVPLSILGCIDAGDALRPWIDGLSYILRDLGPIPYRDLSRERAVRAVLGALKFAFREGVARDVLVPLLRDLPDGDALEVQVVRYTIRVYDTDLDEIRRSVELAKPVWGEDVMATAAQELLQMGRAEGIRIGKAEGKAEMLLKMMRRRFGALSPDAEERVRSAGVDQLDVWSDRFFDAERPEDMFEPPAREH